MIIKPKDSTIAYRCPYCGGVTKGMVGVFALSGDMIKLKCPCGHSELKMTYTKERKLRLSVPCFVCSKNHEFMLSENVVFGRDIILLTCPYSAMDICFIGTPDKVAHAVTEADKHLKQVLKENDAEDYFESEEEEDESELPDFSLVPGITTVVKELLEDGEISCGCDKKSDNFASHADNENLLLLSGGYQNNCNGDIELVLKGKNFVVRCLNCGASYVVDEANIEDFLTVSHIDLF